MKRFWSSAFLLAPFRTRWLRWAAWSGALAALLLLAAFRTATDAEFTFASLALLPVLFIAWVAGQWSGLFLAFLAAAMWTVADIAAGRQFSAAWIPWANALTHWLTYSLLAVLTDQFRRQYEREHEHATRDALTGLRNRRAFLESGAAEAARSERYGHPLAVAFLDLDDFKQLNDTKGHDAGDAALKATAAALLGALRSSDVIARLGGDEFAVLLPETGYEAAVEAGRKISLAVNQALQAFPPVKGSIGVAWFGQADRSFPEMLKAADELMYEVKEGGKDNMRARRFAPAKSAENSP